MGKLWVACDVGGLVGAFSSAEKAREILTPYLRLRWSGALFPWGFEGPPPEGEVHFLVAKGSVQSPLPVFVGTREKALEAEKQLRPSGLVEEAAEIDFHRGFVDQILPHAQKRLDVLKDTLAPEKGQKSLEKFIEVFEESFGLPGSDEPEALLASMPLAGFVRYNPEPLGGRPGPDAAEEDEHSDQKSAIEEKENDPDGDHPPVSSVPPSPEEEPSPATEADVL